MRCFNWVNRWRVSGPPPPMSQEAPADVSWAVAARGGTRHPVCLSRFPDELRAVDITVLLPLRRQGAAWRAAVGGVLPRHMTLSITAWHRTPARKNTHTGHAGTRGEPPVLRRPVKFCPGVTSSPFVRSEASRIPLRNHERDKQIVCSAPCIPNALCADIWSNYSRGRAQVELNEYVNEQRDWTLTLWLSFNRNVRRSNLYWSGPAGREGWSGGLTRAAL